MLGSGVTSFGAKFEQLGWRSKQVDGNKVDLVVVVEQEPPGNIHADLTAEPRGLYFTGDFNLIEPGAVLVGYTGNRTEQRAARQVGGWMKNEGWEVKYAAIDEFYVHIDLMICMLAPKCAAVCLDTTPTDVLDWMKDKKIEMIPVGFRDTMNLECNVVSLGNDRIMSTAAAKNLNSKLRANGFEVYDPDMTMFTDAGGGVHCMAQPLKRDPV